MGPSENGFGNASLDSDATVEAKGRYEGHVASPVSDDYETRAMIDATSGIILIVDDDALVRARLVKTANAVIT